MNEETTNPAETDKPPEAAVSSAPAAEVSATSGEAGTPAAAAASATKTSSQTGTVNESAAKVPSASGGLPAAGSQAAVATPAGDAAAEGETPPKGAEPTPVSAEGGNEGAAAPAEATTEGAIGAGNEVTDGAAPPEGAAAPPEGAAEPPEGAAALPEGAAAPPEGAAAPPEGAAAPLEGTAVPPEGAAAPPEGTAVPPDGTAVPPEGAAAPPEGAAAPPDGTAVPPEGAAAPPEGGAEGTAVAEGAGGDGQPPAEGAPEAEAPPKVTKVSSGRSVFRIRDQKEYDPFTSHLERRITKLFEALDTEGSGFVDVQELGTLVRSVGCCPSESDLQEMVTQLEAEGQPGLITLQTVMPHIVQCVEDRKYPSVSQEQLLKAFDVLAEEKEEEVQRPGPQKSDKLKEEEKGTIPQDKLVHIMTEEGEHFSQEEVEEMLSVVSASETGRIDYTEFVKQLLVSELW